MRNTSKPSDSLSQTLPGEKAYPPLEECFRRTRELWDFSYGFPFAKGDWLRCPCCRHDEILYRHWTPHNRAKTGHQTRYGERCDVHFKCTMCGMAWVHGILVPPEAHEHLQKARKGNPKPNRMSRREALARMRK